MIIVSICPVDPHLLALRVCFTFFVLRIIQCRWSQLGPNKGHYIMFYTDMYRATEGESQLRMIWWNPVFEDFGAYEFICQILETLMLHPPLTITSHFPAYHLQSLYLNSISYPLTWCFVDLPALEIHHWCFPLISLNNSKKSTDKL